MNAAPSPDTACSLVLTEPELGALTGYCRASSQRAWLAERAWVFEVGAKGKPKVLRSYAEAKLGATSARPRRWEPDFSDLAPTG